MATRRMGTAPVASEHGVTKGYVDQRASTALRMVGEIVLWAASSVPTGWLECDGSVYDPGAYPDLAALLGGQLESNMLVYRTPDLRGRVPVGRDPSQTEFDTLGEKGGAKTHTLTEAEMPSHTHTQDPHSHTVSGVVHTSGTTSAHQTSAVNGSVHTFGALTSSALTTSVAAVNDPTGGGAAHNNLQPYTVLRYLIKA